MTVLQPNIDSGISKVVSAKRHTTVQASYPYDPRRHRAQQFVPSPPSFLQFVGSVTPELGFICVEARKNQVMGSQISRENKREKLEEELTKMKSKAHDDKKRRQQLEEELTKMGDSLKVKSKAHYISSEFYGQWDIRLQYASYITGILGASGTVFSTLAWKRIAQNYPRLGPVAAATAATMNLSAILVNITTLPYSPAALHQIHFKAGIECQYLQRQVRFFAKTDVWNMDIPWTTLASRYENLLKERREAHSLVLSQDWAYQEALKKIEKTKKMKMKMLQEDNEDAKKDDVKSITN